MLENWFKVPSTKLFGISQQLLRVTISQERNLIVIILTIVIVVIVVIVIVV